MPKFLTPIDLTTYEIRNAVFQNLATAPSSPKAGQFYYDTTLLKFRYWNNSSWVDVQSTGVTTVQGTAPIQANTSTGTATVSIDAATGSTAGSMSAADKTKLDAATNNNTNSTLVFRDSSGDFSAHNITANLVTGLTTPTNPSEAANKAYVDSVATGLDVKASVRVATTAALPSNTLSGNVLTASGNGALAAVDGVSLVVSDRVLIKNESSGLKNGVYVVTSLGAAGSPFVFTRASDANSNASVTGGLFVFVEEGTTNDNTGWILTTSNPITLNTTALAFTQFSGAGTYVNGNGLSLSGGIFTVVGTASRISVSGSGVDIAATYVGQTSITTLGTVTTGTWNGTAIAVANGGTGATSASSARTNLGVPGKYSVAVGNGSSTSIVVTHNLGTQDVQVTVYTNASTYDVVYPDIQITDSNTITVIFGTAPTTNAYKVVVIG